MTTPSDPIRHRVPVGSEKLIQEGAVSYVQATIALNEFKRIVQEECEKLALGHHLDDINRIMGTDLTEEDLHYYPRRGRLPDTQDPWLCVSLALKDVGKIFIGLFWESLQDGSYQLHAITAFEFSDQKLFQKARQKFDEKRNLKFRSFPYKDKDPYITLSEAIPAEQATSFPEKLETVLEGFLQGWEKMGGLKNLRDDVAKAQ